MRLQNKSGFVFKNGEEICTALFTAIFAFFTKLFLEVSKCLACEVFDEMLAYVIFSERKRFLASLSITFYLVCV